MHNQTASSTHTWTSNCEDSFIIHTFCPEYPKKRNMIEAIKQVNMMCNFRKRYLSVDLTIE